METTKEGQARYDSGLAFFCGVGIGGVGVRSSGEGPVRRRTPVMIGFSFGEDCLIGAGNQKCGLNSGEASVHRRRQHGMRQSEFRSGIGCAAPARVLFAGGHR